MNLSKEELIAIENAMMDPSYYLDAAYGIIQDLHGKYFEDLEDLPAFKFDAEYAPEKFELTLRTVMILLYDAKVSIDVFVSQSSPTLNSFLSRSKELTEIIQSHATYFQIS